MREETKSKVGVESKKAWENNPQRRIEASVRGRAMKGKIKKTPEQCKKKQ